MDIPVRILIGCCVALWIPRWLILWRESGRIVQAARIAAQARLKCLRREDPAAWRVAVYRLDEGTWQRYEGPRHGLEYVLVAREYEAAFRQIYGLDQEAFRQVLAAVLDPQDPPATWRHILTALLNATATPRTWRLFTATLRHSMASPEGRSPQAAPFPAPTSVLREQEAVGRGH